MANTAYKVMMTNAMLFTYNGTMNMRNKKWEMDFSPVDADGCEIDRVTTKAYLHHLFKAQELLAMQIASIHNLAFYLRLVSVSFPALPFESEVSMKSISPPTEVQAKPVTTPA